MLQHTLPFDADTEPFVSPSFVFVRHPRARRYIIQIAGDGSVRVTIPRWGSKREAVAFAESERVWIEKELRRRQDGQQDQEPLERPEGRTRAQRELPPRVLALAREFGLTVRKISVRNQKWRWGSCSPSGHICLNWRLVFMPDRVRDYVIIHELMHLKRMDHSPRFWKLVAQACPDYREARAYLRNHRRV